MPVSDQPEGKGPVDEMIDLRNVLIGSVRQYPFSIYKLEDANHLPNFITTVDPQIEGVTRLEVREICEYPFANRQLAYIVCLDPATGDQCRVDQLDVGGR